MTEYPNASHAFDNPLGPVPPAEIVNGQSVRHCVICEEHAGSLINASTQQPFTYQDPCVELNPHVGYDAEDTEAAKSSVKQILKGSVQALTRRLVAPNPMPPKALQIV